MRPIIVFDLDDVLINNRAIKKDLFSTAMRYGASREEVLLAYARIRSLCFTPTRLAKELYPDRTTRARAELAFFRLFAKPKRYTFSGAAELLRSLKTTHTLLLLTYGDPTFQKLKLGQSQLGSWFHKKIFTKESTKENELKKLRRAYQSPIVLLDDARTICALATELNIPCIRIKKTAKSPAYYRGLTAKIERLLAKKR